ncbi:MAG: NAD(P)-dependent oxidoreductase [Candidatus Binatia bacterium]|nr:NAD(P)-dependent oxidoreductase [Candidatus Binatia bacterium]
MKILVTGGAGYLGSTLVPLLLQDDNNEVTVLDSFTHGVPSLLGVAHDQQLRIVRGDARDSALMKTLAEGADTVIALAAVVGQRACAADKIGAFAVNAGAIQQLVGMLKSDQTLIYPCTNSGYGLAGEKECTEASPLNPTSEYGLSKVLGEQHALAHGKTISLRFATLFGVSPRMRLDLLVNDLVYQAVHKQEVSLYEGHFRRNFLHVRDAARAIIWALDNIGTWKGHIFNVGDSRANMSKRSLCGTILRYVPGFHWTESDAGADPDRRDYVVSNEKIERAGWSPTCSIDDGIVELKRTYTMPFSQRAC